MPELRGKPIQKEQSMEGTMEGLACIGILLWLIGIIFAALSLMILLFSNEDFADCVMKICAAFVSVGSVCFLVSITYLIFTSL